MSGKHLHEARERSEPSKRRASERVGESEGRSPSGEDDDFGGLHRDLLATGAAMDRRGMLRLAARFGIGAGALQLLGCGGSTPTTPSTGTGTGTATGTGTGTGSTTCSTKIP